MSNANFYDPRTYLNNAGLGQNQAGLSPQNNIGNQFNQPNQNNLPGNVNQVIDPRNPQLPGLGEQLRRMESVLNRPQSYRPINFDDVDEMQEKVVNKEEQMKASEIQSK